MNITVKLINTTGTVRLYHTDNGKEIRMIRVDIAGIRLKERQRTMRDKIARAWAASYAHHQTNNLSTMTSEWIVN